MLNQTLEMTAGKNKTKEGADHDSQLSVHLHENRWTQLSSALRVRFVANVTCEPDQLTIFNHPSNLVTLQRRAHIDGLKQQDRALVVSPINNGLISVGPLSTAGSSRDGARLRDGRSAFMPLTILFVLVVFIIGASFWLCQTIKKKEEIVVQQNVVPPYNFRKEVRKPDRYGDNSYDN